MILSWNSLSVRHPKDTSVYNCEVYYEYHEFISKNNQHRFKDINAKSKSARVYAVVGSRRCVVRYLDTYIAHLPPNPVGFYLQPLDAVDIANSVWYKNQRVGVNTLKAFIPGLSRAAELDVEYTNHSLRATGISRMFTSGIPEKVITEKSGHRSTAGVRAYERISDEQHQQADQAIAGTASIENVEDKPHFGSEVKKETPLKNSTTGQSFVGAHLSNCTINITYQN